MKLQCGGLLGLQTVLLSEPTQITHIADIDALITQALELFDGLEQLPYQDIIKFISHYQIRTKRLLH